MRIILLILGIVGLALASLAAFGWFSGLNIDGFGYGGAALFAASFLPLRDWRVGP